MAAITFPLLSVVDDDGAIVSGATVTIASVKTKAGADIASHGATLNVSGENVSVDYDPETKGQAWVKVAISKVGSTFTGLNAAPSFFLSPDPQSIAGIKAKTDSIAEIGVVGTVTGSPTATVIQGVGTALVSTNYTSGMLAFTSGPNKGLAKRITAYNSGTKTFTVSPAFPDTPASGDTFVVLGNKEAS